MQAELGNLELAIVTAREAIDYLPHASVSHAVLGSLLLRAGEVDGARAGFRRAIELDVDNGSAIRMLTEIGGDPEARREDARFVLDRLETRVSGGAGIVEAASASACLPHDERKTRLERLLSFAPHRPDAWEAVVRVRLEAGDLEEARTLVAGALTRFPRWFSLRMLEADVLRILGDTAGEEATLRALIDIAPAWPTPRTRLAERLRTQGSFDEARAVIEAGLRAAPRVGALHLELALGHWGVGALDHAFEILIGALRDGVLDELGFDRIALWAEHLGREGEVEDVLRVAADARPRSATPWDRLARLLGAPERSDDRIAALHEALRRNPRFAPAADLLAETLTAAGRFDDALDACPPEGWVGPVPHTMEGRRAWILAARCDSFATALGSDRPACRRCRRPSSSSATIGGASRSSGSGCAIARSCSATPPCGVPTATRCSAWAGCVAAFGGSRTTPRGQEPTPG